MSNIKRSWLEINLNQISKNYNIYKATTSIDIMAVVKADAYGHGAVKVAQILQKEGVVNFAVSNINEAIELRDAKIVGQILILGYTPFDQLQNLVNYDITQALISEVYANDVISSGIKIKCQYAIDTGMNRIGLDADDVMKCKSEIEKASSHLNLTGLFTHLCVADTPSEDSFTNGQIQKFKNVADEVKYLNLPYVHCLNSSGGIWHQDDVSCYVRLGIILYGLKPDYLNILPYGIKPAMEWKSVISMIKEVHPGETIGYGRTFVAKNDMKIATIPTGYADGYNRELSNKGYVLLHGQKAPIVGRICMDQFMIDVTNIKESIPYDEVVLLGRNGNLEINADDMAQIIGTIGYTVICDIGKRVERVYIEG